jgi:hypothetical protein
MCGERVARTDGGNGKERDSGKDHHRRRMKGHRGRDITEVEVNVTRRGVE